MGIDISMCLRKKGGGIPPLKIVVSTDLFHGDRCYRATVNSLLAIARIAGIRVRDPRFVVPEFEHLGAEFAAKPATDAEVHINFRGSHDYSFLRDKWMGTRESSCLLIVTLSWIGFYFHDSCHTSPARLIFGISFQQAEQHKFPDPCKAIEVYENHQKMSRCNKSLYN